MNPVMVWSNGNIRLVQLPLVAALTVLMNSSIIGVRFIDMQRYVRSWSVDDAEATERWENIQAVIESSGNFVDVNSMASHGGIDNAEMLFSDTDSDSDCDSDSDSEEEEDENW
jgi:hypothetical protein